MTQRGWDRKESQVKSLQHKCIRALQLHTDLAEAGCELLIQLETGTISARDRRRLTRLGRQENAAMTAYFKASMDLITALSVSVPPADQRVCPVISAMT